MWKSKKFILVVMLTIIVLVGSAAGVVFARTGSESPAGVLLAQNVSENETQPTTLLARVAEILEIDQQDLEDAFAQARKEMQDEALDRYLQRLVDDGKINQEQADQYKTWWQARPDTPLPGPSGHFGFHTFRGGMNWGGGHHFWGRAR